MLQQTANPRHFQSWQSVSPSPSLSTPSEQSASVLSATRRKSKFPISSHAAH
jgi:hypothetical protein